MIKPRSEQGFSFITIIIVLAMFGVAASVVIIFKSQLFGIRRERLTRDELAELKQAITGNPRLITNNGRADFGYIGNMGNLPPSLEDLYKKGTQPVFVFNNVKKVGAGWAGPYIAPLITEYLDSLKKDAFGNDYVYSTSPYTRADGEVVSAKITSNGEDRVAGTLDDRFAEILKREVFSTVSGEVTTPAGVAVKNASITLNTPENGTLITRTTQTNADGGYSFSDVTFGLRSIQVSPLLSYVEGSAEAITPGNDDLEFKIINMGGNPVTVTSLKAEFPGTMFYERIVWGATTVWNYLTDGGGIRAASGATKTFNPSQTIGGTGNPAEAKIIHVEDLATTAPTIILKGSGVAKTITLENFRNVQAGPGTAVVVSNVQFTMTFSDGSVMTFIAAP